MEEDGLIKLAAIAAAGLAAEPCGEKYSEERVIEVDCPHCVCAGETIEVSVPKEAGGGTMLVRIPYGVMPGEAFEVPLIR